MQSKQTGGNLNEIFIQLNQVDNAFNNPLNRRIRNT